MEACWAHNPEDRGSKPRSAKSTRRRAQCWLRSVPRLTPTPKDQKAPFTDRFACTNRFADLPICRFADLPICASIYTTAVRWTRTQRVGLLCTCTSIGSIATATATIATGAVPTGKPGYQWGYGGEAEWREVGKTASLTGSRTRAAWVRARNPNR